MISPLKQLFHCRRIEHLGRFQIKIGGDRDQFELDPFLLGGCIDLIEIPDALIGQKPADRFFEMSTRLGFS
jgi:hypothetical protein